MAISINTNIPAQQAQLSLERAQNGLDTSMQRLSTGYRINSAADDAAGLQISNRMSSQINGLGVAVRNANDGISIAQTAEGAMSETTALLQRMRDLAVQSASDSNNSEDRVALNEELVQLVAELNRIAESTTFAGQKLLDGSFINKNIQVGAYANETITVSVNSVSGKDLGIKGTELTFTGLALPGAAAIDEQKLTVGVNDNDIIIPIVSSDSASSIVSKVAGAVSDLNGVAKTSAQLTIGGTAPVVNDTITLTVNGKTVSHKCSTVTPSDAATALAAALNSPTLKATANAAVITLEDTSGQNMILSGTSTTSGLNVNVLPVNYAGTAGSGTAKDVVGKTETIVGDIKWIGMDESATYTLNSDGNLLDKPDKAITGTAGNSINIPVNSINITTYDGAQQAIGIIDQAIAGVDADRGMLGAIQNRFQHTIYNLQNVRENMMGSRSRIKDTDYANEMSQLTRDQVLKQASISSLNRANVMQQDVLALLNS
ncbi:flagellin [Thalassotalea sp. G20_0]|uniref:flagellin N-terminal helical domain-containing protein n=1 Tax=Thalassotalea sp. G20_0 TaxID=2821093 RepID=UPI001ADC6ABD|nr:flagellin [Thalassotalea sp. G20_0]MBO9495288.1 flagellin [Thalassotalea sp. G20_0]